MITNEQLKKLIETGTRYKKEPITELVVNSFEDGVKIWDHPDVLDFFNEKAMKWIPQKETAVFLPCAAHKPYYYSQSHSHGYLKALLPYFDDIDIFVISEPMGVVPYCYSDSYPVDSYDYNPYEYFIGKLRNPLAIQSRTIFIERVSKWLKKYNSKYEKKILMLPSSWHLKIVKKSLEKIKLSTEEYHEVKLSGRAHTSLDYMEQQLVQIF